MLSCVGSAHYALPPFGVHTPVDTAQEDLDDNLCIEFTKVCGRIDDVADLVLLLELVIEFLEKLCSAGVVSDLHELYADLDGRPSSDPLAEQQTSGAAYLA